MRTPRWSAAAVALATLTSLVAVTPSYGYQMIPSVADENALIAAQKQVERLAASDPDVAEIRMDLDRNEIVVYRVGAGRGVAAAAYPGAAGSTRVRVDSAVLSQAQADQISQLLERDWPALRDAGIEIQTFGPGERGAPYRIGVKQADRHRAHLMAQYAIFGAHTVQVVEFAAKLATRQNDSSPYYGGAWIVGPGRDPAEGDGCTSGFGSHSTNGNDYLITAFHCINPNDPRVWEADALVGNVTATNPEFDAAFIRVDTLPRVYDGAWNQADGFNKQVTSASAPATGNSVCTSGAYSGVRCGGIVGARAGFPAVNPYTGQSYTVQGWWVKRQDGANLGGEGDSGGPVFRTTGSTVEAKGIIVGIAEPLTTCTGRPVPRRCSSWVFISDITRIAAARNLNVTQ